MKYQGKWMDLKKKHGPTLSENRHHTVKSAGGTEHVERVSESAGSLNCA